MTNEIGKPDDEAAAANAHREQLWKSILCKKCPRKKYAGGVCDVRLATDLLHALEVNSAKQPHRKDLNQWRKQNPAAGESIFGVRYRMADDVARQ